MRARWRAKPIVSPRGTKVDGFRACKRTRSTHPTIHDVKQRNSFSRHLRPRFEIVRPDRGADGAPRGAPGVERRANELRHADACEALASLSPQGWPASRRSNRGGFHPRVRTFAVSDRSEAARELRPTRVPGGGGLEPPRRGHEPVAARRQTCSAFRIVSRKRPSMSKVICV